jgi:CHAT domain-containing protein
VPALFFLLMAARDSRLPESQRLLEAADSFALLYNWPAAAPLYERSETLFHASGDRVGVVAARLGGIWVAADGGVSSSIVREVTSYLQDPLIESNPRLMLRALIAKAVLERNTNEVSARESWERILKLSAGLGDRVWQNRAKAELGQILYMDGDVGTATVMLREALVSQWVHLDLGDGIHYTSMVGNGFVESGRPESGLKYAEMALKAAFLLKDEGFPYLAYQGKARALDAMGRRVEAADVLDLAIRRARKEQNHYALAQLLIVKGIITAAHNPGETPQALKEATEISEARGFHHLFAWGAFELAKSYRQAGNPEQARHHVSRAITVMREIEDRYHLPQHLTLLAGLEAARGDVKRADELYDEATDVIDGLLVNVNTKQLKGSLIATLSEAYVGHFGLMVTKFGDTPKAYEIIEEARGRSLADALRGDSESLSTDTRGAAAKKAIDQVQLALLRESDPGRRGVLLDALFATEQLLVPVHKVGLALNSRGNRFKPEPIEVVQGRLRPDELLLEYVLDDSQTYCLQLTRAGIQVTVLPAGRKRLDDLVEQYLDAVRSRKSERVAAQDLYALLLGPVLAEHKDKTRVVVVPDGKLHVLPFDALSDEEGNYVLESRTVTYAPSATVFALLRQARRIDRAEPHFLGVASSAYSGTTLAAAIRSADNPGGLFDTTPVTFSDLPGTKQEISSIAAILPGPKKILIGASASESAFKALTLGDYRIIHFALHGVGSPQFPDRAALVIGSSEGTGQDGLLQAREIRELPLRADLVILSACDTGSGKLLGEEGIASLERAFLLAGARSVVASLWTADDTYTIALMKRFYQHLVDGSDEGSALRQAKLDLLKDFGDQALPIYWAGFTLVGDGSTVIFN